MGRVETVFPIFEIRADDGDFWEKFPVSWRWSAGKSTATGEPMKMNAWEKLQEK
jgi:hypothetical protein